MIGSQSVTLGPQQSMSILVNIMTQMAIILLKMIDCPMHPHYPDSCHHLGTSWLVTSGMTMPVSLPCLVLKWFLCFSFALRVTLQ